MWTLISAHIHSSLIVPFMLQASVRQITLENMQHGPQVQLSMSLNLEKLGSESKHFNSMNWIQPSWVESDKEDSV